MSLMKHLGREGGTPDLSHAVALCQAQMDEIAAELVHLSRGPLTTEAQDRWMGTLLGYQVASFSLVAAA